MRNGPELASIDGFKCHFNFGDCWFFDQELVYSKKIVKIMDITTLNFSVILNLWIFFYCFFKCGFKLLVQQHY
jgi:hypothetical protein